MINKLLRYLLPCLLLLIVLSGVCGAENRELTFNPQDISSWEIISKEERTDFPAGWFTWITYIDARNIATIEQNGQTYLDCHIMKVALTNHPDWVPVHIPDSKWHVLLDAGNSRAFILEEYVGTGLNTMALSESKDVSLADNAENWAMNWDVGNAAIKYLRANRPDLVPVGSTGNGNTGSNGSFGELPPPISYEGAPNPYIRPAVDGSDESAIRGNEAAGMKIRGIVTIDGEKSNDVWFWNAPASGETSGEFQRLMIIHEDPLNHMYYAGYIAYNINGYRATDEEPVVCHPVLIDWDTGAYLSPSGFAFRVVGNDILYRCYLDEEFLRDGSLVKKVFADPNYMSYSKGSIYDSNCVADAAYDILKNYALAFAIYSYSDSPSDLAQMESFKAVLNARAK